MPRDLDFDSGTQTVSGTHTLATITTSGIYVLQLNLSALVGGATPDMIRATAEVKTLSGDTEQLTFDVTFTGGLLVETDWQSAPIVSNHSLTFELIKVQGTTRDIPWRVIAL